LRESASVLLGLALMFLEQVLTLLWELVQASLLVQRKPRGSVGQNLVSSV